VCEYWLRVGSAIPLYKGRVIFYIYGIPSAYIQAFLENEQIYAHIFMVYIYGILAAGGQR
jgi:hypothetical protein